MRTRPTIIVATLLAAASAAACVESPPFDPPETRISPEDIPCEGEPVPCLTSCANDTAVATAFCRAGKWSCEQGVRGDLCCDPELNPDQCDTWGRSCDAEQPCPAGYTCVKSRAHPVPAANDGVCRFGDLTIPDALSQCNDTGLVDPSLLGYMGTSPAKVRGVLQVQMTCEDEKCTMDDPCCQTCGGSYQLELTDVYGDRTYLPIRTETLACAGTNCGFSCYPMQPGRSYFVWGLFVPRSATQLTNTLYLAGYCAD